MKKRLVLKVYLDLERDADIVSGLRTFRKPHRGEFVRQAIRVALVGDLPGPPSPTNPRAETAAATLQPQAPLDDVFG